MTRDSVVPMEPRPTSPAVPERVSAPGRGRIPAIARAAGRSCSRPGCDTPAAATLVFSYAEQVARVVELLDGREPQAYDLCGPHADRTTPPRGWQLADTRPPRAEGRPRDVGDRATVDIIAAALRGETPATRVSVVAGGGGAGAGRGDADDVEDAIGHDEDPLRAALEEVQRVVDDPDAPSAPAAPLRRPPSPSPHEVDEADEVIVLDDPLDDDPMDDGLTLW